MTSTVPASLTASAFLFARYNTQNRSFDNLASWAIVAQGDNMVFSRGKGGEPNIFKSAMDINGDGIPELILFSGRGSEFAELLIYEFRGGKLRLIGSRGWEVGFELTIPQTVSDLHGE